MSSAKININVEYVLSQIYKIRLIYILSKANISVLGWEYCFVLNKA